MTEPGETPESDHPGVIAPPPLIFGGVLLLAIALDWAVTGPGFQLPTSSQMTAGLIFALAGLAIILAAVVQFHRAKTNIEPWKPTTTIVTTGVYRFSRNPIYLGMALGYVGLSLLANSVLALAALPVALAVIHYGVILREEQYLEVKFGEEYRDYRAQTRRWI